ncbi:MAG: hypothetical protein IJB90_02865 [Clostridia bacterium]|nr:hypothetical protein [Clostridia bacterium]
MTNLKSKLTIIAIVFMLVLIAIQTSIFASNENIQILEKNTGDYIIYVKDNLNTDFEFAFSNDKLADKTALSYYAAQEDTNGNKIALVNSSTKDLFLAPTYMWVRVGTDYILECVEIDLAKAINENDLQIAANLTKIIKVDTTKTNTTEETIDGKKVTTTVGKVVLMGEGEYSYILIKESEEYAKLRDLATRVSKFNSETDMYTKIQVYTEFFNKSKELVSKNTNEWTKVENNEILQPEDSEDGEKYILWIKEENSTTEKLDIQFLTSYKEYSEEKIVETITTKLPVTYDNNILLIVLAILVVAIIVVCIRIKMLNKREK